MRVRLEDSGRPTNKIVVYTASGEPVPLASKASRKAKKKIREENRIKRTEARQERRTDRVVKKQQRKATKRATKVQRKQNKLVRATGKQALIEARQAKKLDKINSEADDQNNMMPDGSTPDDNQTDNTDYNVQPDADSDYVDSYDDYEMMPDEEPEYEEEMQDLAGGLIGTALDAVKGAVQGVMKQGTQAVQAKASTVQNKVATATNPYYTKYMNESKKTAVLQTKVERANKMAIYTGIGGAVAGVLVSRFFK